MPQAANRPSPAVRPERRLYVSPVRRQQMAATRERILDAASDLVRGFASWDWRELTFRAVAEQAGVGERTVYRHFPTERQLHEAVMQRLEQDAGIAYEEVTLDNVRNVTERIFASLARFSVAESVHTPTDPTFQAVDRRRQAALRRAMRDAVPAWTDDQRDAVAALLDALWNLPTYEHIVAHWNFDHNRAVKAIGWLIDQVLRKVDQDAPPPT